MSMIPGGKLLYRWVMRPDETPSTFFDEKREGIPQIHCHTQHHTLNFTTLTLRHSTLKFSSPHSHFPPTLTLSAHTHTFRPHSPVYHHTHPREVCLRWREMMTT